MRILITGGAGFIGSNFVHYLLENGGDFEITVVDKLTYAGDKARLATVEDKIEFIQADICDQAAMEPLVKKSDIIAHFAAETHVDRSIANPGLFLTSNILGTEVLLRLALQNDVKHFHHVSTDEVFGTLDLHGDDLFDEQTPYSPRSPYAASKAASDHLVRSYGETYGLPYTITNTSNNYGPYDTPARIIPLFITNALEGKPLPIYGQGQFVRDYLHVKDHCLAIDLAIKKRLSGATFLIGGAGGARNGVQVAEAILDILDKPKSLMKFVADRPGHDPRYEINPAYARKNLGWKASVSFEEGLAETVRWYKENESWWKPLKEKISLMRDSKEYEKAKGKRVRHD